MPAPTVGALRSGAHSADPTIFTDLVTSLKQSISVTLESAVKAQQEESTKLKSLRSVRGWNPAGFFGKVECLANTFESVGLCDEALSCFQELDDLYRECLRDGELTFFPSITPTSLSQGDDNHSVLSCTAKPYRDMILQSAASLWDLKIYLLSRRLLLLSKMGRGLAIMKETMSWMGEMTSMVKGQDLPPHCLPAFLFSASLDILHHCTLLFLSPSGALAQAIPPTSIDGVLATPKHQLDQLPRAYHSMGSELLLQAIRQLEKVGLSFEYLPQRQPFYESGLAGSLVKTREMSGVTKAELIAAVEDEAKFDEFYRRIGQRTLASLERGNKGRAKRELQSRFAALDLHRGNYEPAYQGYSALIEGQAEQGGRWSEVDRLLIQRQLECHTALQKPKNRQWVASLVNLLRNMPTYQSVEIAATEDDDEEEAIKSWNNELAMLNELRSASMDFEREVPVSGFGKLSIVAPVGQTSKLEGQDGAQLPVIVWSSLRTPLSVDDVRFCLSGGDGQREQLWLTSGTTTIRPGRNEVTLRTYANAPGRYVVDVSQIRFGRIVFQYVAPKSLPQGTLQGQGSSAGIASSSTAASPTTIKIAKDGASLDAQMLQPKLIALDQARYGDLVLHSGRNHVESATITVKHLDGRPLMGFGAGEIEELESEAAQSPQSTIESTEDDLGLRVKNMAPRTDTLIRFPLDEPPPSDGSAIPLLLEIEYLNPPVSDAGGAMSQPKRILRKRVELATALPLGVNVQDFFKLDNLMSKFSISTGSGGTLKVNKAVLVHADEEDATPTAGHDVVLPPGTGKTVIVTPRQPASFVFKIKRRKGSHQMQAGDSTSLRLVLSYRTLYEDAREAVRKILAARLGSVELPEGIDYLLKDAIGDLVDDTLDVPTFALTGAICIGTSVTENAKAWRKVCETWGLTRRSAETKRIIDLVEAVIDEAADLGPASSSEVTRDDEWRTLEIPVDVPKMDLVNRATLRIVDRGLKRSPLLVGKPIQAEITIETTFEWGSLRVQSAEGSHSGAKSAGGGSSSSVDLSKTLAPASLQVNGSRQDSAAASSAASSVGDFQDAASDVTATGGNADKRGGGLSPSGSPRRSRSRDDSIMKKDPTIKTQRMCYEVQADFENWLVAGGKRSIWEIPLLPSNSGSSMTIPESAMKTFRVTLVPLRAGSLTMPIIATWPIPAAPPGGFPPSFAHRSEGSATTGQQGDSTGSLPSCETYVANVAQRVEVYPVASTLGMTGGGAADRSESGETYWISEGLRVA